MKTIFGQQLDDVHKILIVRLRSIGDMILIGPAVAALRKAYPGAEITVLSEPLCLPVVERNPLYDRVIIFNIQGLKQCPKKQVAAEYFKFSRFLHKKRFDLAVDFHGGPRAAGITLLCGSRHRLGYDLRGRRWAYTIRNEVPIGDPMYLTHLKLIRAIGVLDQVPVDDNLLFPLLSAERQWAEEYIREKVHGLKSELSMKIVVFHIGGRFDFKCWPRECFIELGQKLVRDENVTILLVGGPDDYLKSSQVALEVGPSAHSLAGTISLGRTGAILEKADLMVCNDSGPMHIAEALGTPIVCLFGPTDPGIWAPVGQHNQVICYADKDHVPANDPTFTEDKGQGISRIPVEHVYGACRDILRSIIPGKQHLDR